MERPKINEQDLVYLFPEERKLIADLDKYVDYIEKQIEELEKEKKIIRDAFVEQIDFLLELDRPNIIDKSMAIYKWITK